MTSYQASRLRRGDCVRFLDGEDGRVISILNGWIKIAWDDGAETELAFDDVDEVDLVSASDPVSQSELVSRRMLQDALVEAL
jgi:hypothetical protein